MKKFSLTEFSVNNPRLIIAIVVILTIAFATQFPKVRLDTDPKNMLPATSDVRVYNDSVDRDFALHKDVIVVGIVNPNGIFNPTTLKKAARLTDEILKLKGVVTRDVAGLTTVDDVVSTGDSITVRPLMGAPPETREAIDEFRKAIYDNPLITDRIVSKDGTTTAIYIPLEPGANAKDVADRIKDITGREHGDEKYYVAGDPVARDTFGAEMFRQMGVFSPIAGMVMFILSFIMFKSLFLSVAIMIPAMVIIVWSMGLVIGLGFPIHIMSSMMPVFLMAIATDSIHIFNEFYFRYHEKKDRRAAIIETMKAVGSPVIYSDITTAVGFASLIFANIIPVKVFGFGIAFGTMALLLLSFSLIPAIMMLMSEKRILKATTHEDESLNRTAGILRKIGATGADRRTATAAVGLAVTIIAIIGISRINVNNNMVNWFKQGSAVRDADTVMNTKLGGTALGYMVAVSGEEDFMKRPEAMRYIEALQRDIEKLPQVGKTFSVVDYVKRINRVFNNNDPAFDRVPDTKEAIAQYLFMFSMSAKPSDLDNVADYAFKKANIWIQLKTWDAKAMQHVINRINAYTAAQPLPGMEFKPAGTAYFNLVWNKEVLLDMVKGFVSALVVVFIILIFNFRSYKWAAIAYIPLLFTILAIYGVVGFMNKDFDMPIAVLSCLSLGMAVDFAIHFISRFRDRLKEGQAVEDALLWTAARPGKGIMRNAVLFAAAFSAMIFAPLTPYVTVGLFIASMMFLSALMSITFLPALVMLLRKWLFGNKLTG